MAGLPCTPQVRIYTLPDGTTLDYNQVREYLLQHPELWKGEVGIAPSETGVVKRRGVSKTVSEGVNKISAELASRNPLFYREMSQNGMMDLAKKEIENAGGFTPELIADLSMKKPSIEDMRVVVAMRMLTILHLGQRADQLARIGQTSAADATYRQHDKLLEMAAERATDTGQENSMWAMWNSMSPDGRVAYRQRIADRNNEAIKSRKEFGTSQTVGERISQAQESVNKAAADAILRVIDGDVLNTLVSEAIARGQVAAPQVSKSQRSAAEAKADEAIRNLLDMGISESGGDVVFQRSQSDLSQNPDAKKAFEQIGRSLIDAGYATETQWKKRFRAKLLDAGITPSEESVKRLWNQIRPEAKPSTEKAIVRATVAEVKRAIRDHYATQQRIKQDLIDKLTSGLGLSDADAKAISEKVAKEVDSQIREAAEREAKKLVGRTYGPKKKAADIAQRMVEAINVGGQLDPVTMDKILADRFGLNAPLDPKVRADLQRYANAMQTLPEGTAKNLASKKFFDLAAESMNTDATAIGKFTDKMIAWIYFQRLSGYKTHLKNIVSNLGTALARPIYSSLANPAAWKKSPRAAIGGMALQYIQYAAGIGNAWRQMTEIMAHGGADSKYLEEMKSKSLQKSPFEKGDYGKPISLNPKTWPKYTSRALAAADRFFFSLVKDGETAATLYEQLLKDPDEKSAWRKTRELVTEGRSGMENIQQQASEIARQYEEATGEKMSSRQIFNLQRELIESELPIKPSVMQEIKDVAGHTVFTSQRNGMYGQIAQAFDAVGNMLGKKSKAAQQIFTLFVKMPWMMFTKVPGNIADAGLDFTPYGFIRAARLSPTGLMQRAGVLKGSAQLGPKGSRAYYDQIGRATFGTALGILAVTLMKGIWDDDDDDFIEVYGRRGAHPNSIVIDGQPINYLDWPWLSGMLSLVGAHNDRKRQQPDENLFAQTAMSVLIAQSANLDQSYLKGAKEAEDMVAALTSRDLRKVKKLAQRKYLGMAGDVLPTNNAMVRQITDIFDPNIYSTEDVEAMLMQIAGIEAYSDAAIPATDIWGNDVKQSPIPFTSIYRNKDAERRTRFLYDAGIMIGGSPDKLERSQYVSPIHNEPIVKAMKENGMAVEDYMTDEQLRSYRKEAGRRFGEYIDKYSGGKFYKRGSRPDSGYYREVNLEDRRSDKSPNGKIRGIQEDIKELWTTAKWEARGILFKEPELWPDSPSSTKSSRYVQ